MKKITRILGLAALAGFFLLLAFAPASGPEAAAQRFYTAVVEARISGLPTEPQMKTLRPLLSAELDTLLETARHEQLHFLDANPGEKPPWIEGNLFGSLFEGMHGFLLEPGRMSADTTYIPVKLAYGKSGTPVEWVDTAVLVRHGRRRWRVADIRFGAAWDFKPGRSLREALRPAPP